MQNKIDVINVTNMKPSWKRLFCIICDKRGWEHYDMDHSFSPNRRRVPPKASNEFQKYHVLLCFGYGRRYLSGSGMSSLERAKEYAQREVLDKNKGKKVGARCWAVVFEVVNIVEEMPSFLDEDYQ
jgi:hypothetical protein